MTRWLSRPGMALLYLAVLALPQAAGATTYSHDADGRMTAVVNSAGVQATYTYDAMGNLVSIAQAPVGPPQLTGFEPGAGQPGMQVEIDGVGFAGTTAANTVEFNGVAGAVLYASATKLLAQVPMSATTGPITVTTAGGTGRSSSAFVVSSYGMPPVVSSFSPGAAGYGDTVTVIGQHLNPVAGQTVVLMGNMRAYPLSISYTELTFALPFATGSSTITVVTPFGSDSTAGALVAVPFGIDVSSVTAEGSLAPGGPSASVTVDTYNYAAAGVAVPADTGVSVNLSWPDGLAHNAAYEIVDDHGVVQSSGTLYGVESIHLPVGAGALTYTVLITPLDSGATQFTMAAVTDPVITAGGPAPMVSIGAPGQESRFVFTAATGHFGVGLFNFSSVDTGAGNAYILAPDGTIAGGGTCYPSPSCGVDLPIAAPGTYALQVSFQQGTGSTYQVQLSQDKAATLTPAVPYSLAIPQAGQKADLAIPGALAPPFAVVFSGMSAPPGQGATATVLDGSWIPVPGAGGNYDSGTVPAVLNVGPAAGPGSYTAYIDPLYGLTFGASVELLGSPNPNVVIDSSVVSESVAVDGQYLYYNFSGVAGDTITTGLANLGGDSAGGLPVTFVVTNPDGSFLESGLCYAGYPGCTFEMANLAQTGTYSVAWQAQYAVSGDAIASHEVTGTLPLHVATDIALARGGQWARYTFDAAAGTPVGVNLLLNSISTTGYQLTYAILDPTGSEIASGDVSSGQSFGNIDAPVTGTYTLLIQNGYGATADLTATVVNLPAVTLMPGSSISTSAAYPGEDVLLNLSLSAGVNVGIGLGDLSIDAGGLTVNGQLFDPSGSLLGNLLCTTSWGCAFSIYDAPAAGVYQLWVKSQSTFSTTVNLTTDPTTAVIDGQNLSTTFGAGGEIARLTFSAAAGKTYSFAITGVLSNPNGDTVQLQLYDSSGSIVDYTMLGQDAVYTTPVLGSAGTYSLLVTLSGYATGSSNILFFQGAPISLGVGAGDSTGSSISAGHPSYVTFTATSGDNVGIGVTGVSLSGSNKAYTVTPRQPTGVNLGAISCSRANSGCEVDLRGLQYTGLYILKLAPPSSETMSFSIEASADPVYDLYTDYQSVTLGPAGATGTFDFAATAGDSPSLGVASYSTAPTGKSLMATLYSPSGSVLYTHTITGNGTLAFGTLAATGTYQLVLTPQFAAVATMNVKVISP